MLNIAKVEALIEEHGWKKAYFCRLFDHSRTWIDDWKRGRGLPDANMLQAIADKLDTTVDYLTDKTEQKEKPAVGEPDVTYDDFSFAFHNETKGLSEANKQKLLEMARIFKKAQLQEEKEKKKNK